MHEVSDTEGEEEHCGYEGVSGHKGGMLLHNMDLMFSCWKCM
jgi:hypothetical protein